MRESHMFIGRRSFGAILAAGLFALTLMYGVVVIIFRYAFGVELWNPFH